MGGAPGLSDALRLTVQAAAAGTSSPKAVITVCLNGGPSHVDMYDLSRKRRRRFVASFRPSKPTCRVLISANSCRFRPRSPTSWVRIQAGSRAKSESLNMLKRLGFLDDNGAAKHRLLRGFGREFIVFWGVSSIHFDLRLDDANCRDVGCVAHAHIGGNNTLDFRRPQCPKMQTIERPEHDRRRCVQRSVQQVPRF